ncbi:MAG: hypothetical protein ISP86_03185 [Shewanellaceae bacterium]|nr:hypothetical protein [Shewanellaceae bacterium]
MKTISIHQQATVQGGIGTGFGLITTTALTAPISLGTLGVLAVAGGSIVVATGLYYWLKPKQP